MLVSKCVKTILGCTDTSPTACGSVTTGGALVWPCTDRQRMYALGAPSLAEEFLLAEALRKIRHRFFLKILRPVFLKILT